MYNIIHLKNNQDFIFLPYLAIDSECLFPSIIAPSDRQGLPSINSIDVISRAKKTIVFTNWAVKVINKTANILTGKDLTNLSVIPHGVDNNIWKPLPNKDFLREKYFNIKPSDKTFLLGSVNRSQPRKRLDAILQTLQILKKNYSKLNIKCHFHCSLKDRLGWNMLWLARYYEVSDMCIFDKNLMPGAGPPDEILNEIVNCYDAHISLANSEGWSLTTHETMAAGVPNIALRYSAIADWGKNAVMFVEPAAYEHEPRTGFVKALADVRKAANCVRLFAESPRLCAEYSKEGLKLAQKLDWKKICSEYWEPMLDAIDVSGLRQDRFNRLKLDHRNFKWINIPEDPINTPFSLPEV
jgi:glycosyltransferase involved in cell wall biosynthesis